MQPRGGVWGAYVQLAADRGLVALATCNSPIHGHFVLPAGGRQGRLATNPIAYAFPTDGDPILADFSTSVTPEGKIRVYRNRGESLPEGWVQDAEGQPTTDPDRFYGPPRGGILPLAVWQLTRATRWGCSSNCSAARWPDCGAMTPKQVATGSVSW
ncbi:MAG: hypothetical protein Ct9H300mP1_20770 [Planctomycetaceae bacterium]|nr:MAG: hypothetical protein Ct9H300mP1_20770 [Planctomycetaceae bacterium]